MVLVVGLARTYVACDLTCPSAESRREFGIAAAHRDRVGRLHDLVRARLGELLRDVDPEPA